MINNNNSADVIIDGKTVTVVPQNVSCLISRPNGTYAVAFEDGTVKDVTLSDFNKLKELNYNMAGGGIGSHGIVSDSIVRMEHTGDNTLLIDGVPFEGGGGSKEVVIPPPMEDIKQVIFLDDSDGFKSVELHYSTNPDDEYLEIRDTFAPEFSKYYPIHGVSVNGFTYAPIHGVIDLGDIGGGGNVTQTTETTAQGAEINKTLLGEDIINYTSIDPDRIEIHVGKNYDAGIAYFKTTDEGVVNQARFAVGNREILRKNSDGTYKIFDEVVEFGGSDLVYDQTTGNLTGAKDKDGNPVTLSTSNITITF